MKIKLILLAAFFSSFSTLSQAQDSTKISRVIKFDNSKLVIGIVYGTQEHVIQPPGGMIVHMSCPTDPAQVPVGSSLYVINTSVYPNALPVGSAILSNTYTLPAGPDTSDVYAENGYKGEFIPNATNKFVFTITCLIVGN
jgi:hypothetical protein